METDVRIQARGEVIYKDKMVVEMLRGQTFRIYFESIADRLGREKPREVIDDYELMPEVEEPGRARPWWRARGAY